MISLYPVKFGKYSHVLHLNCNFTYVESAAFESLFESHFYTYSTYIQCGVLWPKYIFFQMIWKTIQTFFGLRNNINLLSFHSFFVKEVVAATTAVWENKRKLDKAFDKVGLAPNQAWYIYSRHMWQNKLLRDNKLFCTPYGTFFQK